MVREFYSHCMKVNCLTCRNSKKAWREYRDGIMRNLKLLLNSANSTSAATFELSEKVSHFDFGWTIYDVNISYVLVNPRRFQSPTQINLSRACRHHTWWTPLTPVLIHSVSMVKSSVISTNFMYNVNWMWDPHVLVEFMCFFYVEVLFVGVKDGGQNLKLNSPFSISFVCVNTTIASLKGCPGEKLKASLFEQLSKRFEENYLMISGSASNKRCSRGMQ